MTAERSSSLDPDDADDLHDLWGPAAPEGRPLRVLGLFAHPDDEVFCAGGVLALAARTGAETALVSLTRGDAGQIRDHAVATRRTLGRVRAAELQRSASALGVAHAEAYDLGDGVVGRMPEDDVAGVVLPVLERLRPDVVLTFGDDGAFGHPDHTMSARAVLAARERLDWRPRVLQARFPPQDRLLLDLLVDWLTADERRFVGTAGFANALRLFADGSSMLGFAADHLQVQWFPPGSYVIEQGEPPNELFCILSGSVDVVREAADGTTTVLATVGAGSFVGEEGLATNRPRNAHVVARDDVTCFVLAPRGRDLSAGRGTTAVVAPAERSTPPVPPPIASTAPVVPGAEHHVRLPPDALDAKIAALVAHRSQYALDPDLLPRAVLGPLLGTEHFVVVD